MYRDEEEALRQRVEALEQELKTERGVREAAEERAQAAEARALEASIKEEPAEAVAARRRRALIITVALAAAVLGLMFSGSLMYTVPKIQTVRDNSSRVATELMANEERLQQEIKRQKMMLEEQGLRLRRSEDRLKAELSNETVDPITLRVESKKPPPGHTEETWKLMGNARKAFTSRDHKKAQEMARAILKRVPDDPRAMMLLGATSCHLGDASTAYQMLLKLSGQDQVTLVSLCRGVNVLLSGGSR